jgi:hypothetical protein
MSHTSTTETEIKHLRHLKAACERLGLDLREGHHTIELYSDRAVACDASVQLPDWRYRVALNLETGELKYDNYEGIWGQVRELDSLVQAYNESVVREETQDLLTQGYTLTEQVLPNGDLQLVYDDGR